MSEKWIHATVECPGCGSYSVSNFIIRRGQTKTVTDKNLVKELKRVKALSVVDVFETVQPESQKDNKQKSKKGK